VIRSRTPAMTAKSALHKKKDKFFGGRERITQAG
jgi:hypothetical protein